MILFTQNDLIIYSLKLLLKLSAVNKVWKNLLLWLISSLLLFLWSCFLHLPVPVFKGTSFFGFQEGEFFSSSEFVNFLSGQVPFLVFEHERSNLPEAEGDKSLPYIVFVGQYQNNNAQSDYEGLSFQALEEPLLIDLKFVFKILFLVISMYRAACDV